MPDVIVRMWEVKARPAGQAELLTWLCDDAVPSIEVYPLHMSTEVFSSADNRLVVISKWRSGPVDLPEPPEHLVARSPHVWEFTQVDR